MTNRSDTPLCALLLCLLLAGCDDATRTRFQESKSLSNGYSHFYTKECIEGVTYIAASHSVTVQFTPEGKVIPCQ